MTIKELEITLDTKPRDVREFIGHTPFSLFQYHDTLADGFTDPARIEVTINGLTASTGRRVEVFCYDTWTYQLSTRVKGA